MDTELRRIIEDCLRASHSGKMTFPEIVATLAQIGVERYHADYSRNEVTCYFVNGDSHVATASFPQQAIASTFSAFDIAAAVRQSQRNEHSYLDFVRKTMAAGCVGYFVHIAGRCANYFGRNGDSHIERFPTSPKP